MVARSLIQLAISLESQSRDKEWKSFLRLSIVTVASPVWTSSCGVGSEDTIGRRRVSAPNVAISSNVLSRNNRRASSLITADTHVTARRDYWNASTIRKGTSTRLGLSPERASARDCSLAEPRPRVCHEIADYHRSRKPPTLRRLLALVYQPSRPLLTYLCHGLLASEKLLSTGADRSIQFQFCSTTAFLLDHLFSTDRCIIFHFASAHGESYLLIFSFIMPLFGISLVRIRR